MNSTVKSKIKDSYNQNAIESAKNFFAALDFFKGTNYLLPFILIFENDNNYCLEEISNITFVEYGSLKRYIKEYKKMILFYSNINEQQ